MPHEPTVACIMLTKDRPELAKRAVECLEEQTYAKKFLMVLDTGNDSIGYLGDDVEDYRHDWADRWRFRTIGRLRNEAIERSPEHADILIHWDDDDWSHPNRIAEQVALLQASGADCVGYNEMLFWREPGVGRDKDGTSRGCPICQTLPCSCDGQAWLYAGTRGGVPALGTSLCYWRKTWERHHFANETQGVEDHWLREKNVVGVSSLYKIERMGDSGYIQMYGQKDPRMIARIHGGNTSNGYDLEKHVANGSREWKRVPEWDARVRDILG